jgi:AAT family amino acid transporter
MSTAEVTLDAKETIASDETYGTGYLEERKLVGRWRTPWPQIVSFLFVAAIFYVSWWIFMDPRGVLRLYTPQVGYMYTRWMLIVAIWMVYLFQYWPFKRKWLEKTHPVIKGVVLTVVLAGILMILIQGFFFGLIGNFAMSYFSPARMIEMGVPQFFALEYASLACLMFASLMSWLSPAWPVAFQNRPWEKLKQPALGLTVLAVTFMFSIVIYMLTMHSHMSILFYPWQQYTAVTPPWWMDFAGTVSGNFHIAWIMSCTVVVWLAIHRDQENRYARRCNLLWHHPACICLRLWRVLLARAQMGTRHYGRPLYGRSGLALAARR